MIETTQKESLPAEQMLPLISQEMAEAALYLELSRRISGPQAPCLRALARQEESHGACLKGIFTLICGTPPAVSCPPLPAEDLASTLRLCYGRTMRRLVKYEAAQDHPEYGVVFRKLALQERKNSLELLKLIGSIK